MTQPANGVPTRILVVDDEPQNLELMEAILQDAGYKVFQAAGGEEALAVAHEKRPDLIILDLMMPGLSGFEVCARVKMDPQTGGIPVLFVTALNQIADKERALAVGGDDFVTKPVQYAELLARVEALFEGPAPESRSGARLGVPARARAGAPRSAARPERSAPRAGDWRPCPFGRGRRTAGPAAPVRHPSRGRLRDPRGRERTASSGHRPARDH